jgi:hypothetical protein
MKNVPISKKCRICHTTELLNHFEIDADTIDKHASICKECSEGNILCSDCVENQILKTATPMIELLIDLVKDGMHVPQHLVKKIDVPTVKPVIRRYKQGSVIRINGYR